MKLWIVQKESVSCEMKKSDFKYEIVKIRNVKSVCKMYEKIANIFCQLYV
jgi:hypothetical protein